MDTLTEIAHALAPTHPVLTKDILATVHHAKTLVPRMYDEAFRGADVSNGSGFSPPMSPALTFIHKDDVAQGFMENERRKANVYLMYQGSSESIPTFRTWEPLRSTAGKASTGADEPVRATKKARSTFRV